MKKIEKGKYGYLKSRKNILFTRIAIIAAIIVALVIASRMTGETMQKITTVMAILAVLPLANIGAVFIAMMPYVGKSAADKEEITSLCSNDLLEYELVVTSSNDPTVYYPYLSIYANQIIALAEGEKLDVKRAEEYLVKMLDANGIETKVRIYDDRAAFIKKLQEMEPYAVKRESCSNKLLRTEGVILALSM